MILKLTTSQKAEIWVNLDQVMQMTTINVQDGYPSTEIIMANGALDQDQISRPARAKPCAVADRLEDASGRGWRLMP
jgi:hypothetical protein